MTRIVVFLSMIALAACGGVFAPEPFNVTQSDTRFSASGNPIFTGHNNRISSKSIAGGTHIDAGGVFIDPAVEKDRQTGSVLALALLMTNRTDYSTNYGTVNQLGLPDRISFALDGGRTIILPISRADVSAPTGTPFYNSVSRSASIDLTESGVVTITRQQFEDIISARSIAVQIRGTRRSVTYEPNEIAPSFVGNLRTFYQQHVQ